MKKLYLFPILLFLFKTGYAQELDWSIQLGNSGDDRCSDITNDDLGNVYVTGWFKSTIDFDPSAEVAPLSSAGNWDAFVQKLDPEGNLIWVKRIGGSGGDGGDNIFVNSEGYVFVSGFYSAICDFDPNDGILMDTATGPRDLFLEKLDPSGNLVWHKTFDGYNFAHSTDLQLDDLGNIYLGGFFSDSLYIQDGADQVLLESNGTEDGFLMKFDSEGTYQWNRVIGGETGDRITGLTIDSESNVYSTGYYSSTVDFELDTLTSIDSPNVFYLKHNSEGNPLWLNNITGSNAAYPNNLRLIDDKLYAATSMNGYHIFNPDEESIDLGAPLANILAIQCFDLDGNLDWIKLLDGGETGQIAPVRLSTFDSDHLVLTGAFQGAVDFDPNETEHVVDVGYGLTGFVYRLNSLGSNFSLMTFPGDGLIAGNAISEDGSNNIYFAGQFFDTPDFDPSDDLYEYASEGGSDAFVSKLHFVFSGLNEISNEHKIMVYPNPFNDYTTLDLGQDFAEGDQVLIHNTIGQEVYRNENINGSKLILTRKELERGVYLLSLTRKNDRMFTVRLIVE